MGEVVLDDVTFFLVVAAFLLFDVFLLFVLLIRDVLVSSLLLVVGDAPNVNEVADPLLFVGSVDVVVGLLMFNLDESKENAGDGCCLDSSFDLLLVAAALLVTLLLSFDDDILVCDVLYLCNSIRGVIKKGIYTDMVFVSKLKEGAP